LPGKNIREMCGKPLIAWTIEAAHASKINVTIVSTDDVGIADVARAYGANVPFIRPPELSTDTAKSADVALHALNWFEDNFRVPDAVVLLQPTSPTRTAGQINVALYEFGEWGKDSLISLKGKKVLTPNGCIYIASRDLLKAGQLNKNPVLYHMEENIPDIDTEEDWHFAEVLFVGANRPNAG